MFPRTYKKQKKQANIVKEREFMRNECGKEQDKQAEMIQQVESLQKENGVLRNERGKEQDK